MNFEIITSKIAQSFTPFNSLIDKIEANMDLAVGGFYFPISCNMPENMNWTNMVGSVILRRNWFYSSIFRNQLKVFNPFMIYAY